MKIKDITTLLEAMAHLPYAEGFDNVGLLVGNREAEVRGVLITIDTLEAVVDEAIAKGANLIVSFHPIIFSGLKSLTGKNYVERVVMKAIANDIAIYSMHTALDNQLQGVNATMADKLKLTNRQVLIPQAHTICKLVTYIPHSGAAMLREALFAAGAGAIGNYDCCSFNLEGAGTFKGNDFSHPTIGVRNELHTEPETQIGVVFPRHLQGKILKALRANHPYEEIAYEVYTLENDHQHIGLGLLGELEKPIEEKAFLTYLQEAFALQCIRHSALRGKYIKKVAVLGGSGAFAIENAKRAGADAFVTADLKYHDFFKAEDTILLADIGHYESEQYIKNLLFDYLSKKITTFAVSITTVDTNPIKYYS